jgi:hypothetical protein
MLTTLSAAPILMTMAERLRSRGEVLIERDCPACETAVISIVQLSWISPAPVGCRIGGGELRCIKQTRDSPELAR